MEVPAEGASVTDALWVLRALKVAVLVVGAVIVYLSWKSYRQEPSRSMLFLAAGFGFVTIGAVLAGVFFEVLKADLLTSDIAEGGMVVVGFALILYSIFGKGP